MTHDNGMPLMLLREGVMYTYGYGKSYLKDFVKVWLKVFFFFFDLVKIDYNQVSDLQLQIRDCLVLFRLISCVSR